MTKKQKIKQIFNETKDYFTQRMGNLSEENRTEDACAMYEELREWLLGEESPVILTLTRRSKT